MWAASAPQQTPHQRKLAPTDNSARIESARTRPRRISTSFRRIHLGKRKVHGLSGNPAGISCVQLNHLAQCRLFGLPERPAVCASLKPSAEICGQSRELAMTWLTQLEHRT